MIFSLDLRSFLGKKMYFMNRNCANVSSCKTPVTMTKKSMLPSVASGIFLAVTFSLERTYSRSICFIFPLCMESNVLEKSTN